VENLGHRDVSPPGHGSCGHVRVPQTGEAGLKCHHAVMGLERSCVSELVKGSVERHAKLLSRAVANCEERHDVTPAEAKTNKVRHQDILRRQGRVTGHTIVGAVGVEGPWVTVGREDLLSDFAMLGNCPSHGLTLACAPGRGAGAETDRSETGVGSMRLPRLLSDADKLIRIPSGPLLELIQVQR